MEALDSGDRPPAPPPAAGPRTFWDSLVACNGDLQELLRVVNQRVVQVIGDGSVLALIDGGELTPVAVLHRDPATAAAMEEVLRSGRVRVGEGIAGSVAAHGVGVTLNNIPAAPVTSASPPWTGGFYEQHPPHAMMIVPLRAGARILGTLGAIRTESAEPYEAGDLGTLETLAERAALAIVDATEERTHLGPDEYEAIFRHSLDGVLFTAPDGRAFAANPAACSMLGLSEDEICRRGRAGIVVADDAAAAAFAEREAIGHMRAELLLRRGDASIFPADVSSTVFVSRRGEARAVVLFRDISAQVAQRETARRHALELEATVGLDELTHLRNRRGFVAAAAPMMAAAARDGARLEVAFLDIDDLKVLNDDRGHAVGDAALAAVARAIDASIRSADIAARIGGDEFVILLHAESDDGARTAVDRITAALLADPGTPPGTSISAGTAVLHPGRSLEAALAAADRRMYEAKTIRHLSGSPDPLP